MHSKIYKKGKYCDLEPGLFQQWHTSSIARSIVYSIVGHFCLAGLLVISGLLVDTNQHKFQLSDATTVQKSLSISMKIPRPPANKSPEGMAEDRGGSNVDHISRFNSDVLQKNRREIYNSIVYPRMARKMGWEGRVQILVTVAADGKVLQASVASSSGFGVLDDSALEGVRVHRFTPGSKIDTIALNFRFKLSK